MKPLFSLFIYSERQRIEIELYKNNVKIRFLFLFFRNNKMV